MNNPKLSDIFRITAEEIHMSQKELSEKTGITVAAISHYFTGSRIPTLRNFYLICLYLGLDTEYVLGQIYPEDDAVLRKVNKNDTLSNYDRMRRFEYFRRISGR